MTQSPHRTLRVVAGTGPAPRGAVVTLALAVRSHAVYRGLKPISFNLSRCSGSGSRYVIIADRAGRHWIIRVSDHHRPNRSTHERPHFDLVSRDGASGYGEVQLFLDRIASAEVEWTDPAGSGARPLRMKRRRK